MRECYEIIPLDFGIQFRSESILDLYNTSNEIIKSEELKTLIRLLAPDDQRLYWEDFARLFDFFLGRMEYAGRIPPWVK